MFSGEKRCTSVGTGQDRFKTSNGPASSLYHSRVSGTWRSTRAWASAAILANKSRKCLNRHRHPGFADKLRCGAQPWRVPSRTVWKVEAFACALFTGTAFHSHVGAINNSGGRAYHIGSWRTSPFHHLTLAGRRYNPAVEPSKLDCPATPTVHREGYSRLKSLPSAVTRTLFGGRRLRGSSVGSRSTCPCYRERRGSPTTAPRMKPPQGALRASLSTIRRTRRAECSSPMTTS